MVMYTLRWISVALIYVSKVGSVYCIEPFNTQKANSLDKWKNRYLPNFIYGLGMRSKSRKLHQ